MSITYRFLAKQQITFLSDGEDNNRDLQYLIHLASERVLDWFHISMRMTVRTQIAKGICHTDSESGNELLQLLNSAKGCLWYGNAEEQTFQCSPCCAYSAVWAKIHKFDIMDIRCISREMIKMKLRVTEWGNSHGVRITSSMMEHLHVKAGDEVEVNITDNGIEIVKNNQSLDYLGSVKCSLLDSIHKQSEPVTQVEDPYAETDVVYIVIAINPCSPEIRQVPIGTETENAFNTLADAKEAARQHIQSSIAEAQQSLSNLRQVGIGNISYIEL